MGMWKTSHHHISAPSRCCLRLLPGGMGAESRRPSWSLQVLCFLFLLQVSSLEELHTENVKFWILKLIVIPDSLWNGYVVRLGLEYFYCKKKMLRLLQCWPRSIPWKPIAFPQPKEILPSDLKSGFSKLTEFIRYSHWFLSLFISHLKFVLAASIMLAACIVYHKFCK